MSTLASVVIRDLLANQPAASIPGRMFYAYDTGDAYRDNGASWDKILAGGIFKHGIVIDGGGAVPSTGSKGFIQVAFSGTILGWTMLADQTGSAQITVKKSTYAGFPTTASIVAAAQPALSAAQKNTSTTLTGWTTTVTAGDVLEFNLDSVASCQRITLQLKLIKT